jgi:hypothetical protein
VAEFRVPQTRQSVQQMQDSDPSTANAMRDERDRALEDYVSNISGGIANVVTFRQRWVGGDANVTEVELGPEDLTAGVWQAFAVSTCNGFTTGTLRSAIEATGASAVSNTTAISGSTSCTSPTVEFTLTEAGGSVTALNRVESATGTGTDRTILITCTRVL